MSSAKEITVDVTAKLSIDRRTADICLRMAEMYANDNGLVIAIVAQPKNGGMEYSYEPAYGINDKMRDAGEDPQT